MTGRGLPAQRSPSEFGLGPAPRDLPELRHRYTAALQRTGNFRTDATGLAADAYKSAQRLATLQRGFEQVLRMARQTVEEAGGAEFAIPVRRTASIPAELREYVQKADRGELSKTDLQAIREGSNLDALREHYFPSPGMAPESEIVYVDRRLVADLAVNLGGKNLADKINNALRASVLYTRPAYAVNLLQNLGTATMQQGVFAPANARAAARLGKRLGEDDRQLIFALMGEGKARAIEPERIAAGIAHELGEFWNAATDRGPRAMGWLHEARRAGFKSDAEIKMLLHDPRLEETLIEVTRRANREMIDYAGLTPAERKGIKRYVMFYPWLRASALWSARFPLEHPMQAAVYASLGDVGADWLEENVGAVPDWMQGRMPVTGGEEPWFVNPQMLSNFSTVAEVPRSLGNALELSSPALSLLYTGATGENTLGYEPEGYIAEAGGRGGIGERLGAVGEVAAGYVPGYTAAKKAEKEGGITLGGPAAGAAQFLGGSLAGGPIDLGKAREMAERERRAELTPEGRAEEDLAKELAVLKRLELPPESESVIREALLIESRRDMAFSKIERETSTGVERERRKLQAVIDAIEEAGRLTPAEAKKLRRQYERAKLDADALRGDRDWLWKRHAGDDLGWYRKRAKSGG